MFKTDQKHMLDDAIDHPKDLLVTSKSKHSALLDTGNGNSILVTGNFSESMEELENDVRQRMVKRPFGGR